jgi:hypothetical protein
MNRATILLASTAVLGSLLFSAGAQDKPEAAAADPLDEPSAREELLELKRDILRDQMREVTMSFTEKGRDGGEQSRKEIERGRQILAELEEQYLQMTMELRKLSRMRAQIKEARGAPAAKPDPVRHGNPLAGDFIKVGPDYINLNYVSHIYRSGERTVVNFVTKETSRPYGPEGAAQIQKAMERISR